MRRRWRASLAMRAERAVLIGIVGCLIAAGCATPEPFYPAKQLPVELQAQNWQAPCTVDLSQTVTGHHAPEFDSGDEVEVMVATGLHSSEIMRIKTTIGRDGTVELPILGRIPVAGTSPETARQAVLQACHRERVSQAPLVQVSMQQPRQHRITVAGAVQHPGIYMLPRQSSDLVSALAAAGGVSRDAGTKVIVQSRGQATESIPPSPDLLPAGHTAAPDEPASFAPGGERPSDRREIQLTAASVGSMPIEQLRDGDVITVERRDPPSIVVTGMVNQPGRVELPVGNEFRILDALANAKGVSYRVLDKVLVCRSVSGRNERVLIQVSLREATRDQNENILLMPGDIVSVESNPRVLAQDVMSYIGYAFIGVAPVIIK